MIARGAVQRRKEWWPWILGLRVRALEIRVGAQGQRILALEEQNELLGQEVRLFFGADGGDYQNCLHG